MRAPDEKTARKVIPTVVTSPSEAIIGVINQPNAALGVEAAVTGVALSLEKNATLVEVNGRRRSSDRATNSPICN